APRAVTRLERLEDGHERSPSSPPARGAGGAGCTRGGRGYRCPAGNVNRLRCAPGGKVRIEGRGGGADVFRRFPALRERIPHRSFLPGATPVLPVPLAGVAELWVKQDDRCTPHYGGDKPREVDVVVAGGAGGGAR